MPPLLVIAGPTAAGKTGLSLRLAEALAGEGIPAEIVSADSRQVYRGMDIGTAKVSAADRERVRHHGLDLVEPPEPFSVADYVRHVADALTGIGDGGALAILVGGTGLYLRAVGRGLPVDELPFDPEVRERLEGDLERDGLDAAAERLTSVAPRLAAGTDLRNPRRVVRALEIALIAGDRPRPALTGYAGPSAWIGLDVPADRLRTAIAERAAAQFAGGLLDEAEALRLRYGPELRAFSAMGYREAFDVLDGRCVVADAIELDSRRTWAFAQRQRTWFRSERDIAWLPAGPDDPDPLSAALLTARRLVTLPAGT